MEKLTKDLKENVQYFKGLFKDCDDILFREIEIGDEHKVKIIAIFVDGMANKEFVSDSAIQSLFWKDDLNHIPVDETYELFFNRIFKEAIASAELKKEDKIETIIDNILSGDTALLVENMDKCIVIGSRDGPSRSIEEPKTETVIRGPRDGFNEIMKFNLALVRRRIKDPKFKVKFKQVGRRSRTTVAVLYIDDIVDKKLLDEVKKRLDNVDIDAVLDSAILENLIEDNYLSPFPQVENTERPDSVAAALYEGRVGLIVDNSPFALIVPATMGTLIQSSEDYYERWSQTTIIRIIRIIAMFLSFTAPALYIAITAYHPGLLPTKLIYFLAASRINVPFPSVVEAILMELTMELLREAGTRVSGPIGSTIGIVGGLIIGQAAVDAGIVSPLMIIIVAVTTISTFAIPSYEMATGFRTVRFTFIALAGVLGLYGVVLGIIVLLSHFIILSSFGIPFTSPFSGLGIEEGDLKDTLVKAPIQRLWLRPGFTNPKNKRRMRGHKK
ncbi:spore germination protein [Paratissierella segnis]|uniref:Spore germination protein n=1 Tax=Paratissierella segnis TaxID=2763679 RepID=A0A926ILD8_9FIRM|nr:spore germination protein [Paratissierella segnis]MBC8588568.1 spore germination protein [Paratissierella segnis]